MYPFSINCVPAYSRDYKNKKEILADYLANKDFQVSDISSRGYINRQDCLDDGISCLIVRYKNLKKVTSINVIKNKMN